MIFRTFPRLEMSNTNWNIFLIYNFTSKSLIHQPIYLVPYNSLYDTLGIYLLRYVDYIRLPVLYSENWKLKGVQNIQNIYILIIRALWHTLLWLQISTNCSIALIFKKKQHWPISNVISIYYKQIQVDF